VILVNTVTITFMILILMISYISSGWQLSPRKFMVHHPITKKSYLEFPNIPIIMKLMVLSKEILIP
jgi:hypothetical protein